MDPRALEIFIAVQALITRRDGHLVENKVRESLGQAVAHGEEDFAEIENAMALWRTRALELRLDMKKEADVERA